MIKSTIKKFLKALVFGLSTLFLGLLFVIRPIVRVRLLVVGFHKFGHLALEPEIFLSKLDLKKKDLLSRARFPLHVNIWSFGPKSLQANQYLAGKWASELWNAPSWLVDGLIKSARRFTRIGIEIPKLSIQGVHAELDLVRSHLSFSANERHQARQELLEFGIEVDKPFACLVVRDAGHNADPEGKENPGYALRNFDIEVFLPAAQLLVSRGYQVVRMGAGKEKPIPKQMQGVFDYAVSPDRSEFLDVFLAGNCEFAISTQTGPDCVSLALRRPVCFLDVTFYGQFFHGTALSHWSPALLHQNEERLTLRQITAGDAIWIKDPFLMHESGIRVTRSSSEEIVELVASFIDSYESNFALTPREERLNLLARSIIDEGSGIHGRQTFGLARASLNPHFLSKHGDWFLS